MNTSKQYARNRKFEYPDDCDTTAYADRRTLEGTTIPNHPRDDIKSTSDSSFVSQKSSDLFLELVDVLIEKGNIEGAMACLSGSIVESQNPYAVKRLGDLFQMALQLEYSQNGFTKYAAGYAQGAIGMYLMYVKLTDQIAVVEEDFNALIQCFGHLRDFQLIFQDVKNKVDACDKNEIIHQFFK